MSVADDEAEAERLILAAYTSLPLQPRQSNGTWEATVIRCGRYEIKLREAAHPDLPLWLELFDLATRESVDGVGFTNIEDGIPHLVCFLRAARETGEPS